MSRYLFRVWTGPCAIREIADKLRAAEVKIKVEGTEHLYVWSEGTDRADASYSLIQQIKLKHGTDLGLSVKAWGAPHTL